VICRYPFTPFPPYLYGVVSVGSVRDFLRGVGILSSAGITVSNAGTRLLNLRNDLNRLASGGATGTEKPITEERLVGYGREAVAAAGKRTTARAAAGSETALERKRRLARESMRRLRAKRRAVKNRRKSR